jgi:hypothetical protein
VAITKWREAAVFPRRRTAANSSRRVMLKRRGTRMNVGRNDRRLILSPGGNYFPCCTVWRL